MQYSKRWCRRKVAEAMKGVRRMIDDAPGFTPGERARAKQVLLPYVHNACWLDYGARHAMERAEMYDRRREPRKPAPDLRVEESVTIGELLR